MSRWLWCLKMHRLLGPRETVVAEANAGAQQSAGAGHIPAQNSASITCRRHHGQKEGGCREGVTQAAEAAAKFSLVPKAGLN